MPAIRISRTTRLRLTPHSSALEAGFCREALEAALRLGRPDIFNSDQGAQFTAMEFTATLRQACELIYPGDFADGRQLGTALDGYFRFYNHSRPHQALAYRTPAEVFGLPTASIVKV